MKDPYNIINFETVYVLLKKPDNYAKHRLRLRFSEKRKCYFFTGRLIKQDFYFAQRLTDSYPLPGTICLLDPRDEEKYENKKVSREKQSYLISIALADIDYITIDVNSLRKK